MSRGRPTAAQHRAPTPVSWALVLAVAAGAYGSLDSMLNVAFPDLVRDLGMAVVDVQWLVVAYVLSSGGALIGAGRLGDQIGHHRTLAWGGLVSTLGLALCAAAPNFGVLVAGRVVQGLGTAFVMASAPALVTASAADEGRGRALGLFQMSAAAGLAVGPLVAGTLVSGLGWRAVFWTRVPVGLALALVAGRRAGGGPVGRPAVGGPALLAVTLATALTALNLGLVAGWSPVVVALSAAGLVLVVALGAQQRSTADPVVALDLLARPAFLTANLLAVAANGAAFVGWLFVPQFVVRELGRSAFTGGLVLAMTPLATALVAPVAGRLSDRIGPGLISAVGLAVLTGGLALGAAMTRGASVPGLAGALVLVGLGLGLFTVPNMAFVFGSLPADRQGVAGGVVLTMRTVGIVVGVGVLSRWFGASEAEGFGVALGRTFGAAAVVTGVGAVVSAVRLVRRSRPRP